jgi:hypothetical protein
VQKLILRDGRSFTVDERVLDRLQDDLAIYGSPFITERGIPRLAGGTDALFVLLNAHPTEPIVLRGDASRAVERLLTEYGLTPSPASEASSEEPAEEKGRVAPNARGVPRIDGLYYAAPKRRLLGRRGQGGQYLRFYGDGTVVEVTSSGSPDEVARWFSRDHAGSSIGRIALDESQITFETSSPWGVVEYSGTFVDPNTLEVNIRSRINGRRFTGVRFVFAPVRLS